MLLRPVTKAETGPLPCHSGTSGKVHTNGEEGWLPWSACEFCGPLKKKSQSVSNRATILFYQAYMTMTVQSNTINQSISRIGQTCWITLGTYQITETDLQIIPLCWSRTCVFFFQKIAPSWNTDISATHPFRRCLSIYLMLLPFCTLSFCRILSEERKSSSYTTRNGACCKVICFWLSESVL